jgi:PEP-CTERM motif
MSRFHILLMMLLLAIAVPFAAADTIQLNFNNVTVGTATLTHQSGGVMVTLSASSGFSFKLQGGDILFNSSVNLNASNISQIMINGAAFTGNFSFGGPATRMGQKFDFNLTQLNIHGVTSAKTISFFISGVTVKDLTAFGVHFCTGDGPKCLNPTNFAFGTLTPVPEPGTLGLLGTGIVALAGVLRRRFIS